MCMGLTLGSDALAAPAPQSGADREPQPSSLVERAESRLAQLDITVTGEPDVVSSLTAEDFVVRVNFRRIVDFHLDRFCAPGSATGPDSSTSTSIPGEPRSEALAASYLFYYDQTQLTLAGRQRALDVSRQLIPSLITGGHRAMIVSNAAELEVIQAFTSDPRTLLEALERLEHDRTQWDAFSEEEEGRIALVVNALNKESTVHRAINVARGFQREESWRTARSLRRLATTLARLADVKRPKAVIYFADALRSNPGEHYLTFFGEAHRRFHPALAGIRSDGFTAGLAFDRLINEAAAQGIRFYAVQAQGLVTTADRRLPGVSAVLRTQAYPSSSRLRHRDAQNTLNNMAGETGGEAFINGVPAHKIARRMLEDISCLYVVSFDPTGFQQDAPLRAEVKLRNKQVQARMRGRLVLPSPSARLSARLLAAFALAEPHAHDSGVRAHFVPTGYDSGSYTALLQLSVPGTALPGATWDVGASLVSRQKVREEVAGRVSVELQGVPVVLEREVRVEPGSYEVVTVAHEVRTGFVLSDSLRLDWADPDARPFSIGPLTLLQPAAGVFERAGEIRTSGSLALADGEPVSVDLPTALIGLVCRGRRQRGALSVARRLVGAGELDFPLLELDLGPDRCVQLRDLVPANTIGPGLYRYEVRLLDGRGTVAETFREFVAIRPAS